MALGDPCCHGHWCVQHWYGWKFPAWCAKNGRASSAGPRPTPQATSRTGRLVSVLSPLVYSCHHLVQPHHSSPRPSGSPLLPTPCLSQSSHQRAPVNTESGPAPSVQWSRVPISLGVKAQVLPWLTRPSAIFTRTLPALPSSLSLPGSLCSSHTCLLPAPPTHIRHHPVPWSLCSDISTASYTSGQGHLLRNISFNLISVPLRL